MKKFIAIVAFFAAVTVANAQQFGLKGGLTLSTINGADTPKDNKAMVLYEAGVLYKADLGAGFAIQHFDKDIFGLFPVDFRCGYHINQFSQIGRCDNTHAINDTRFFVCNIVIFRMCKQFRNHPICNSFGTFGFVTNRQIKPV